MRCLVAVVVAGCGRISFDPLADAAQANAPFDAPFSAPQRIVELSTSFSEDDPSLTGDLLELYFASLATPTDSLWRSTRLTIDDPWSAPEPVAELNAGGGVNNPKVTLDGLTIYFGSLRAPSMMTAIWKATRPDRSSAWNPPVYVVELDTAINDYEPYELPDHLTMYLTRNPSGSGATYRATRLTPDDPYGTPVAVAELDASGYDGSPFVTADELGVMFHSQRGGGNSTIYRAARAAATDVFSTPTPIPELDMAGNEEDPWLSPDGKLIVFSADPTGTYDLYMATR